MSFSIDTQHRADGVVLHLSGQLDISSADVLRATLDHTVADRPNRLVLDMSELDYMSSAGLRCLASAHQQMGEDIQLVVTGARREIIDIIRLAGLDHAITLIGRLT
ncbi:STAS domain-containing protein [Kutzneria kofuensis]|uniref:Anti-sigma factor antagonist n=1 Tax=Kutzneria kofuensis TaxID=103725 RepID=A0A7W9KS86_9PSEU|nr:STAS domain-containing protein [Kutzneria kofuensis]MBB5896989.1 anti-anti-sigma factor [Kutzneria kofuensis]